MTSTPKRGAPQDQTRQDRRRLHRKGLRPIEIWVPDVRSPAFLAEAHRQSRLVAASSHAAEDQAFIDFVSELNDP